jgi:hypothetical protein
MTKLRPNDEISPNVVTLLMSFSCANKNANSIQPINILSIDYIIRWQPLINAARST